MKNEEVNGDNFAENVLKKATENLAHEAGEKMEKVLGLAKDQREEIKKLVQATERLHYFSKMNTHESQAVMSRPSEVRK